MRALLAAAPPALALVLLLARVSPVRASLAALATGVVALLIGFPVSSAELIRTEAKALVTGLEVALIILGGVLLYELTERSGAQQRLGEWVGELTDDRGRRVLLVVLGVTPFVESVTGFGVGVIVAAPLLLRMGFGVLESAVLGLLGLVAVPWGGLAVGTLVAARLAGVPFDSLGAASALLSLPVFLIVGAAALWVALGRRGAVRRLPELLVVAAALCVGIWAVNRSLGTPLAGALGSLVAIAVVLALARLREGRVPQRSREAGRASLPYALLVALLGASQGAATLLPAGLARAIVASPAPWLFVTCALIPLLAGAVAAADALRSAAVRWLPVAAATFVFLALGALMTASGMSAALAEAGTRLGQGYLLLAPWIGGVGGFLTGSNSGANAMFATAQVEAAAQIGYPPLTLLAVQNVSASLLTMASAPRVALAASLLGPDAASGRVLRAVLLTDAVVLVALGALSLWLAT